MFPSVRHQEKITICLLISQWSIYLPAMISDLQYFFSFQIKKQIHLIFFIECAQDSPALQSPHPPGLLLPSSLLVAAFSAWSCHHNVAGWAGPNLAWPYSLRPHDGPSLPVAE